MKVAISGDLKGSRTIHSFVYALARFGATIDPLPAPGMELPAHVDRRLREEFHSRMVSKDARSRPAGPIDALYVTANQPHQLSLYAEPEVDYGLIAARRRSTRSMSPASRRSAGRSKDRPYPKIDAKFLGEAKYSDASVMHPLPRVNELDASFDSDRRAVYFQQAAYGVPVRMALISLLLHLHKNKSLHKFAGGFAKPAHPRLRAADRHRHQMRQSPIASPAIRPNANTPPTSSTSSTSTTRQHGQAALRLLRDRYRGGRGRAVRRRRHDAQDFSPGLAALGAGADARSSGTSSSIAMKPTPAPRALCRATAAQAKFAPARTRPLIPTGGWRQRQPSKNALRSY